MLVAVNLGLVRGPGGVDVADIVSCPRGVKIDGKQATLKLELLAMDFAVQMFKHFFIVR